MELDNPDILKALVYERQYEDYSADLAMYKNLLDAEIPVIEFGSGTGRLTSFLLKLGFTVYGIENEPAYRQYFRKARYGGLPKGKFRYISDVRKIKEPCTVIFPFNVVFYLSETDLERELSKFSSTKHVTAVFETDHIQDVTSSNLREKSREFGKYSIKETSRLDRGDVIVTYTVRKDQKIISEFRQVLFLHRADKLISLYNKYFATVDLFGSFQLERHDRYSNKLIAMVHLT